MHAFADGGSAAAGAAAGKAKQIVRGMPESEARMILNVDQKAGDADVVEVRSGPVGQPRGRMNSRRTYNTGNGC